MLGPLVRLPGVEEIPQGLIVDFNEAGCEGELRAEKHDRSFNFSPGTVIFNAVVSFTHTNLPALCSQLLRSSEDLLHSSGNDASGPVELISLHGVRLSASCLPVGEAADVVAVQRRLHQQRDLFKDLRTK